MQLIVYDPANPYVVHVASQAELRTSAVRYSRPSRAIRKGGRAGPWPPAQLVVFGGGAHAEEGSARAEGASSARSQEASRVATTTITRAPPVWIWRRA